LAMALAFAETMRKMRDIVSGAANPPDHSRT